MTFEKMTLQVWKNSNVYLELHTCIASALKYFEYLLDAREQAVRHIWQTAEANDKFQQRAKVFTRIWVTYQIIVKGLYKDHTCMHPGILSCITNIIYDVALMAHATSYITFMMWQVLWVPHHVLHLWCGWKSQGAHRCRVYTFIKNPIQWWDRRRGIEPEIERQ